MTTEERLGRLERQVRRLRLCVLAVLVLCVGALLMGAKRDRGEEVMKVQIVSIDESPTLRWEALRVRIEE